MQARIGRRGAILLLLGTLWIVQGLAIATAPGSREPGAYTLLHEQLPTAVRVTLWCGTGLVAVLFAFRPHPAGDGPGFGALIVQPVVRFGSFFYGAVAQAIPGGSPGYPRGLIGAATWATIAALVILIARWLTEKPRTGPASSDAA